MHESNEFDTYKSFYCTDIKQQLESSGVAVIPILSQQESEHARSKAWSDMTRLIGITESDPSTYKKLKILYPEQSMLINRAPLGHLQWVWDIRQDPRVAEVFASIWNVPAEDLLVSFDSISLSVPPEVTEFGWYNKPWIHVDQSIDMPGFACVQGFMNLYQVNPGDSTLYVLEGSHKYFNEYFEWIGIDSSPQYFQINQEEAKFFTDRGCEPKRVLANAGDLVLWDSRVFHMGSQPIRNREKPNFRLVCYICMLPRAGVSQRILDERIDAYYKRIVTNHWANDPIYGSSVRDGVFPFGKNDIGVPELTPLGRRLVGFDQ